MTCSGRADLPRGEADLGCRRGGLSPPALASTMHIQSSRPPSGMRPAPQSHSEGERAVPNDDQNCVQHAHAKFLPARAPSDARSKG